MNSYFNVIVFILLVIFLNACKTPKEIQESNIFDGRWVAQWDTDPAGFPDISDKSIFTMDGYFEFFEEDKVTVTAFGFPGCIFSNDTLSHTLFWQIQNDTLSLINEGDVYGISYKINEMSSKKIQLQLMEDIFITLSK